MIFIAALLCAIAAVIHLASPYLAIPAPYYPMVTNVVLLLSSFFLLGRGAGTFRQKREADIGAPQLLTLGGPTEKHLTEVRGLENKIRQLETQVGAARRRETEMTEDTEAQVVSLLSTLQNKGRFIDFLMDDVTQYDDAQVGAAARIVHQGCRDVVRDYFDIAPVRNDQEGSAVTLDKDFDSARYRLVGKVGQPPYRGTILHRGWMASKIKLPRLSSSAENHHHVRDVIAPAEIELG